MTPRRRAAAPLLTFLSDFGDRDGFVGIVKGVLLSRCPDARIVDLSHAVPAGDVLAGALVLESAVRFFPKGTVHLAVVDPGVGSERRGIAIETLDFTLVGPDNGLLLPAARRSTIRRIVHLDRPRLFLPDSGSTFHGRDVFAPVAARIAAGSPVRSVGSAVADPVELEIPEPSRRGDAVAGEVLYVDRFGNLVTNVSRADLDGFRGSGLSVTIGRVRIPGLVTHYAAVGSGRPLALWNSWDRLEIAVRDGSAAKGFRARRGTPIRVSPERSPAR